MSSRLERKALWTVTDEGTQELSQSSNEPGPGDNLMATQEARMPFAMSDGQEFRGHGGRNTQAAHTRRAIKVKNQFVGVWLENIWLLLGEGHWVGLQRRIVWRLRPRLKVWVWVGGICVSQDKGSRALSTPSFSLSSTCLQTLDHHPSDV